MSRSHRPVPTRFWITEAGNVDAVELHRATGPLKLGWIRVRRRRDNLTFTCLRLDGGSLNRVSKFLHDHSKAGKTAKLVFLRPRTVQVTWPAFTLSRRRYSERWKGDIEGLKADVRRLLPECKPRKGRQKSHFFNELHRWLKRHRYFRSKWEYELLGADGGILDDAMNTSLPKGFSYVGEPTFRKSGSIIRLRCGIPMRWQTFFQRIESYVREFGHGNAITGALFERGFIRIPFMTVGSWRTTCVHCGELQVEGPGALKAMTDYRRTDVAFRRSIRRQSEVKNG